MIILLDNSDCSALESLKWNFLCVFAGYGPGLKPAKYGMNVFFFFKLNSLTLWIMVKISSYDFDEGPGGAGTGGVLGVLRGLLKTKILVAHFFLFVCFKVSKEN